MEKLKNDINTHKNDVNTHKNSLYKPKNQEKMLGQYELVLFIPLKFMKKQNFHEMKWKNSQK
jgi:hypothetical protein